MLLFGLVHRVTSARFSRVSAQPRLLLMCLLVALSSVPALAQDIPEFAPATAISDNVATTAGPVIVNLGGTNEVIYTDHVTNELAVGVAADATTTAIPNGRAAVNSSITVSGLGQVKATVLNSTVYVSYIGSSGFPELATSTSTGPSGFTIMTPRPAYSATAEADFVPTIFAFNGELWVALVTNVSGTLEVVFDMSSDGGTSWTQETVISGFPPISTVSLADFNGILYAAYITSAASAGSVDEEPVFGSVLQGQTGSVSFNRVNDGCCHNSTSNGSNTIVPGATLIGVPGEGLYIYVQAPSANDTIFVTAASDPTSAASFATPHEIEQVPPNGGADSTQSFRWDFSALLESDNSVAIVYQQSGSTDIDYTFVLPPPAGYVNAF
jgi:hypothetical protein